MSGAGDRERLGQQLGDPVGDHERLLGPLERVADDHELVAAEPRDRVAGAHGVVQSGSERAQQLVARGVAVRVVDQLEEVEVEEQDAHPRVAPGGLGEALTEPVGAQDAVGQPGERVVEGPVARALFGADPLDGVGEHVGGGRQEVDLVGREDARRGGMGGEQAERLRLARDRDGDPGVQACRAVERRNVEALLEVPVLDDDRQAVGERPGPAGQRDARPAVLVGEPVRGTQTRLRAARLCAPDRADLGIEHFAHGGDDVLHQLVEAESLQGPAAEARDRCLLGQVALQVRVGRPQALAGGVERARGMADLGLQHVVAVGHLAELVAGAHVDRDLLRAGVGAREIAAAERGHRPAQVGHRAARQPVGGVCDLLRGVGDHARQDEADGDSQQPHGHEDVREHRGQLRPLPVDVRDGQQVAGAVQRHHRDHRAGQLHVQRAHEPRGAAAAPVVETAPGVEHGARIREAQAGQDGGQAELLEAQEGRHQPHARDTRTQADRPARRPVGPGAVGLVAAQQQHGDARHADADQVAEVRGGDDPHGIAGEQEGDRGRGGEHGRHPRHVAAGAAAEHARQEPVVGQLRQRARGAGQRLQRAVEHVEDHEPDGRGLGRAAHQRSVRRAERAHQLAAERAGAQRAQPDDGEHHEVQGGDGRRRVHGAGHVALGVDGLADVAGGRLEGRGGEPDEVEARHGARHRAERAGEGQLEVERRGAVEALTLTTVLKTERIQLENELAAARRTLSEQAPSVQVLGARLKAMSDQIAGLERIAAPDRINIERKIRHGNRADEIDQPHRRALHISTLHACYQSRNCSTQRSCLSFGCESLACGNARIAPSS